MIILLCLLGIGIRFRNSGEDILSKEITQNLKGIAAIYIVLSHLMEGYVETYWIISLFHHFQIISNGMFFFLSGYGLYESVQKKENYLSLKCSIHRILNLGIPVYLAYLIDYYFEYQKGNNNIVRHLLLGNLLSWFKINGAIWFIIELIFLYIFFWLLYSLFKKQIANIILLIMIVVWILIAFMSGRGIVWYASSLCFLEGIVFSQKRSVLRRIPPKNKISLGLIMGGIWGILLVLYNVLPDFSFCNYVVIGNLVTILWNGFLLSMLYKVKVTNKITYFLGAISYEIYLVHMYPVFVVRTLHLSLFVKEGIVLVVTILLAYLVSCVWNPIRRLINSLVERKI